MPRLTAILCGLSCVLFRGFAIEPENLLDSDPVHCKALYVGAIALQTDGRILITDAYGLSLWYMNTRDGVLTRLPGGVWRLMPDGTPDLSFVSANTNRSASEPFNRWLTVDAKGRVLVSAANWGITRLLPNGKVDDSFALHNLRSNTPALPVHQELVFPFALSEGGQRLNVRAGTDERSPAPGGSYRMPMPAVYRVNDSGCAESVAAWPDVAGVDAIIHRSGLWAWTRHQGLQPSTGERVLYHQKIEKSPTGLFAHSPDLLNRTIGQLPPEMYRLYVGLPRGKRLLGVSQSTGGQTGTLLRFDKDWVLDREFAVPYELGGRMHTILAKAAPDGSVYLSGDLRTINGLPHRGLTRLHPDGRTDTQFRVTFRENTQLPENLLAAMEVQPDGAVLVGGLFTYINGVPCSYFARLLPDGSVDVPFTRRFDAQRFQKAMATFRARPMEGTVSVAAADEVDPAGEPDSTSTPDETIRMSPPEIASNAIILRYEARPETEYVLETREGLLSSWLTAATNRTSADGLGVFTDTPSAALKFYRVLRHHR